MKKFFNFKFAFAIVALLSLMSFTSMAVVVADDNGFSFENVQTDLLTIFLPALGSAALVLFSDAWKHFNSTDWSWKIFIDTKLKSFCIISGIALVLVLVKSIVSISILNSLSNIIGVELTIITSITLFGFATSLYDNFTKKQK